VGSTLRNGIVSMPSMAPQYFVVGMFSALSAAFVWLLVATLLGLPGLVFFFFVLCSLFTSRRVVSTTHTIVAGIFAFGVFEAGISAINTTSVIMIGEFLKKIEWSISLNLAGVSWIVSPLAGFVVALLLHGALHWLIYRWPRFGVKKTSEVLFPVCAGITAGFMSLLVILSVHKAVGLPLAVLICVPIAFGIGFWLLTHFVLLPMWQGHQVRRDKPLCVRSFRFLGKAVWGARVEKVFKWGQPKLATEEKAAESNHMHEQSHDFEAHVADDKSILTGSEADAAAEAASQSLFESLLVATAALVAFAHSANDIANSVAPYVVCFEYATTQSLDVNYHAPFWLFVVAGVVLCSGLLTLGFVVMRTIGEKITKLQPMGKKKKQFENYIL
jgi:phosphate/sulfate permease